VRIDPAAAGEVRPLWTSTRRDRLPARDATTGRVAFCSDRTGGDQVYLADGPDAAPVRITDFQGLRLHSLAFAPTGGRLMFWASRIDAPADDADVLGSSFVGLLDVDDGSWRRLDQPGREVASPLWAADGRSIFVVAMQDEMWACRRVPIDGGGPGRRLLVDYIVPAHHCAATEELLFFRYGHPGLFRLPLGEGDGDRGDLAAAGFPDVDRVRGHAGHGSRLFGLVQESDFTTLIRYDAVAQRTDTLAVLPLAVDSGAFAVADDLSWAVLSTVTRHHRDLMHLSQLP